MGKKRNQRYQSFVSYHYIGLILFRLNEKLDVEEFRDYKDEIDDQFNKVLVQ